MEEFRFKAELELKLEGSCSTLVPFSQQRLRTISLANHPVNVGSEEHFT